MAHRMRCIYVRRIKNLDRHKFESYCGKAINWDTNYYHFIDEIGRVEMTNNHKDIAKYKDVTLRFLKDSVDTTVIEPDTEVTLETEFNLENLRLLYQAKHTSIHEAKNKIINAVEQGHDKIEFKYNKNLHDYLVSTGLRVSTDGKNMTVFGWV